MWEKRGRGPHPPRLWDGGKTSDDPYAWKSKKQTPKLDDSMYIIRSQPRPGRTGWRRRTLRFAMVLLENTSLPRQNSDPRCFSSGLFLPVALRSPALCWLTRWAQATQGQWAADGGSPGSCCLQILWDSRPGAG